VQDHQLIDKVLLKRDLFGEVWKSEDHGITAVLRDARPARWWLAWLARSLLRREAKALAALQGIEGIPQLISHDGRTLLRSFLPGVPMYIGRPSSAAYFRDAARLLRRIHSAGVVHNDLAKEPNILVAAGGLAAFIDFQLASYSARRGRVFRIAAREDIRHLLKHKRTYRPDLLTKREHTILNSPSLLSRAWMSLVKPVYLFVTRRLLGWSDREGAADRPDIH
jgi:RIO-like serine/threonine protein kinase